MSLISCPDCGHEVSTSAVSCPNCGHPFAVQPNRVTAAPRVIVTEERSEFPKWVIIPIVIVGGILLFMFFALFQNSEDDTSRRVNVNLDSERKTADEKVVRRDSVPNQIEVPGSATTVATPPPSAIPQNVPASNQTEIVTIPTKGDVLVEAKITTTDGTIQSVKKEKFYLLDKDLEMILSDADLEPIEGQTLSNSLGLAILFPDKYGEFQKDALNAIKKHIKYDVLTDSNGKASMKDVKPDGYYLFGITKNQKGFAIWNSRVTIVGGENKLNLSPVRITEVSE